MGAAFWQHLGDEVLQRLAPAVAAAHAVGGGVHAVGAEHDVDDGLDRAAPGVEILGVTPGIVIPAVVAQGDIPVGTGGVMAIQQIMSGEGMGADQLEFGVKQVAPVDEYGVDDGQLAHVVEVKSIRADRLATTSRALSQPGAPISHFGSRSISCWHR